MAIGSAKDVAYSSTIGTNTKQKKKNKRKRQNDDRYYNTAINKTQNIL